MTLVQTSKSGINLPPSLSTMNDVNEQNDEHGLPFFEIMFCNMSQIMSNKTHECWIQLENDQPMILTLHIVIGFFFSIGMPLNLTCIGLIIFKKELHSKLYIYLVNCCVSALLTLTTMVAFITYLSNEDNNQMSEEFHEFFFDSIDDFLFNLSFILIQITIIEACYEFSKITLVPDMPSQGKLILFAWGYSVVQLILATCRMIDGGNAPYKSFVKWCANIPILLLSALPLVWLLLLLLKNIQEAALRCINPNADNGDHQLRRHRHQGNSLSLIWMCPLLLVWCFLFCIHAYEIAANHQFEGRTFNFFLLIAPWLLATLQPILFLASSKMMFSFFRSLVYHIVFSRMCCRGNDALDYGRVHYTVGSNV